jgi:hypothetical protein
VVERVEVEIDVMYRVQDSLHHRKYVGGLKSSRGTGYWRWNKWEIMLKNKFEITNSFVSLLGRELFRPPSYIKRVGTTTSVRSVFSVTLHL